jgi:ribonuclease P protein subunit RPR2
VRLLLCDDSAEARAALRTMLAAQSEIAIVGEAENGRDAIALALELHPDVVLTDVSMPLVDGVETTKRIRALLPAVRIVAFAGSGDEEVIAEMLEAGANAYCVKGVPLWELERAIMGATDPLVRLAHALARAGRRGAIGDLVARELAELTGAAYAATYLAAPDVAMSLAGTGGAAPTEGLAAAPAIAVRAFETLGFAHADSPELAELNRLGVPCAEALAAPLVVHGERLGALLVAMPPTVQPATDAELVAGIADLAAAAIANERRLALTHAEARRDALTGLANKRAFDEQLERATRDALATDGELALVLLDLDDFKQINDREGHAAGDEVLRQVARVLARSIRLTDGAFRIGGEEFAILVAGGSTEAWRVADRVRDSLRSQRRGLSLPTASVGIAALPANASRQEELVVEADRSLYAAKRSGKDRIVASPYESRPPVHSESAPPTPAEPAAPIRLLLVDDDPGTRILVRTTFEVIDIEVEEAESADEATRRLAARRPDVIVLDVALPGKDGLTLCRELKSDPETSGIGIVLLTGTDALDAAARDAGADALLRKPFSPLGLLRLVERLAGGLEARAWSAERPADEQVLLYAQDLRRLLELEQGQRVLLQRAYRETVAALASALEWKDMATRAHSQRVVSYATELALALEPQILLDPSVEHGFLLHDIGKLAIPDSILLKPEPLTPSERRLMQTHTALGEQMLGEVALLQGQGLTVVRSHHERWDGRGYPDGLTREETPLAARVFVVADALDAMTSDRPYRSAGSWDNAVAEVVGEAGKQFDPDVVDAFRAREPRLRRIHYELVT